MEIYHCRLTKRLIYKDAVNFLLHTGRIEAENRAKAEEKIRNEASRIKIHSNTLVVVKAELVIDKQWQEIHLPLFCC